MNPAVSKTWPLQPCAQASEATRSTQSVTPPVTACASRVPGAVAHGPAVIGYSLAPWMTSVPWMEQIFFVTNNIFFFVTMFFNDAADTLNGNLHLFIPFFHQYLL